MRHVKNSLRTLNCMRVLVVARDGRKGYTTTAATRRKHPGLYRRLRREWISGNRLGLDFSTVSIFLV